MSQETLVRARPADRGELSRMRGRLRDFHDDYAATLDRGDLDAWPDFFTAEARYRVMSAETYSQGLPHAPIYCEGRGMLLDRIAGTRVMVFEPRQQRRQFFNVQAERFEGERLEARASFLMTEAMMDRDPVLAMTGMVIDRFLVSEDRLLLEDRLCVYDNYRIVQNLIFPV